ncbi:TMEM175 family protein [Halotia branconii]|uniref:TMEM175 family protein n=1 Tax=Halotia branconii CENA392 TaxID=1539056 RepID=A0AAJ6NPE6_9CYAN|nr:TMEM175 family protein [Halotia branconii]WGV24157.1 TMEM175 family protein [Halotia branconii CENA392]
MNTSRLEAFSDGVFAIAITLLVLEIKVPPPDTVLGAELLQLWPSYLAYVVSFLVIGAIWINHHAMFHHIVRVDGTLLLLNVLHLMLIAFLPFPTAVLAEAFHRGTDEPIAAAFYSSILTVIGIFVNAMWRYAAHEYRLIDPHLAAKKVRKLRRQFLFGPIAYAIATVVALVLPWLAVLLFILLNLFYLWPRWGYRSTPSPIDDSTTSSDTPAESLRDRSEGD